jgi:hypothetical protein
MNKVEKMFIDKALKRSVDRGITFYSKNVALEFVRECKKEGIVILGIDAFFLTETTTQPSMEDSIDFSASSYKGNDIYQDSIVLLETRKDNMHFEIVCGK